MFEYDYKREIVDGRYNINNKYHVDGEGNQITLLSDIKKSLFVRSVSSINRLSNTATVTTSTPNNFSKNIVVTLSGSDEEKYNSTFVISNLKENAFDIDVLGDPVTPATGVISVYPSEKTVIEANGSDVTIKFTRELTVSEKTTLDNIVQTHKSYTKED